MATPFSVAPGCPPDVAAVLQQELDELNFEQPPDHDPPPLLANMRHACTASRLSTVTGRGVSTAIDLKERYWTFGDICDGTGRDPHGEGEAWALIFREGSCKKCGAVARSSRGRIVATAKRPPAQGRVARG